MILLYVFQHLITLINKTYSKLILETEHKTNKLNFLPNIHRVERSVIVLLENNMV